VTSLKDSIFIDDASLKFTKVSLDLGTLGHELIDDTIQGCHETLKGADSSGLLLSQGLELSNSLSSEVLQKSDELRDSVLLSTDDTVVSARVLDLEESGHDWGHSIEAVGRHSTEGEAGGDLEEVHLLSRDTAVKFSDVSHGRIDGIDEVDKLAFHVLENSFLLAS